MHFLVNLVLIVAIALAAFALFTAFVARKVDQHFPPPGQWLEVDGERVHYRSMGTGPAIVMVHGLAGQSKNFDYLPLAELASRWRVVLMDRPGSGFSPRRDDSKAGIAAQGRLVVGCIQALQLERPPLLVGHSLGGAIALSAALQHPEAIAGLALIAPLTHFSPDVPAPFRALAIRTGWLREFFGRTLAVPLTIVNSRRTLALIFGPEAAPTDFPVRGGGLLGLRPVAFRGASTDMVAVQDDLPAQQQRYGELRVPVRVLYGEGDQVLDWRAQGEALAAKAPQTELKVIPGGHMLPVTQAAATSAWLEETAQAILR